jgi:large subunit ribosomal protein L30
MSAVAVIRIRGHVHVRQTIEDTMRSLRLTRANHCVVLPGTEQFAGMLEKVKDYTTFGSVDAKLIEELLTKRGRLEGDAPLTDAYVKANSEFGSIKELAAAMAAGTFLYKDLPGVKPLFRLNPPRKGHKGGTKRAYNARGSLGDRGEAMGELLSRMV